ncbi:hypothetical protein [Bacillus massiliglaciei]|nr:hypothetical protein [Bacillus massiliglaciei]
MKIVSICPSCHGSGKVPYLQFFSRNCIKCEGSGKIIKHTKELKKNNPV